MMSISVALCTFNGAEYLAEQLRSILAGTRKPDEIVISDDASTDDTTAIAEEILSASGVPFAIRRNPEPLGVTLNFASAVAAAAGDILVLSDQDDVWEAGRLEAAAEVFASDTSALLHHSDATLVDSAGRDLGVGLFEALEAREEELAALPTGDAFGTLLRRNLVTGATVAFRRELLEEALPFPPEWVHDEWIAILAAARDGVRTDRRRLVRYRQHGGNQIGMTRRSVATKIRRVFGDEGGRLARIATRSKILADRLATIEASPSIRREARRKAEFEAARASLPRVRWARVPLVLELDRTFSYARYASQGRLDMMRDLGQRR